MPSRLVAAAVAFVAVQPLSAADWVVTRYDDPAPNGCAVGDCSLREAVIATNFDPDFDRILLSAGRYELTQVGSDDDSTGGDLDVNRNTSVIGPGAGMTTIDANLLEGVFHAGGFGTKTFRGFTVLGGITDTGKAFGIQAEGATVVIEEVEIRGDEPGTTGNALTANASNLTVRRSTISAAPGTGLNAFNSAVVTLENVTIAASGNNEIFGLGAAFTVSNSSLLATADASADVSLQNNSTIAIENTILVGTCGITTGSSLTSLGGNLQGSSGTACGFNQTFDQQVADAQIGPLSDNGGPVLTAAPIGGSPAIDTSSDTNCLLTDARGVSRPSGEHCDSGAVEVAPSDPLTPIFFDGFLQGDREAWSLSVP